MNQPYKTVTRYQFEVCDELIAITEVGEDYVIVEEVRNNGQEDTHMSGVLAFNESGEFSWSEGERLFVEYGSQKLADAICLYLNEHGVPKTGEET
jgi:hypothetical protein